MNTDEEFVVIAVRVRTRRQALISSQTFYVPHRAKFGHLGAGQFTMQYLPIFARDDMPSLWGFLSEADAWRAIDKMALGTAPTEMNQKRRSQR